MGCTDFFRRHAHVMAKDHNAFFSSAIEEVLVYWNKYDVAAGSVSSTSYSVIKRRTWQHRWTLSEEAFVVEFGRPSKVNGRFLTALRPGDRRGLHDHRRP